MPQTVESIENNNVAIRTKDRYHSTIFGFVMWLYNHREAYEGYLRPEVVAEIQAVLFDTTIPIKQRRKKLRRAVVDQWCKKMSRQRPENCPVLMEKVDYKCVSEYMVQKTTNEDKLMSKGTYCGIRSGIIYLYTMSNLSPPPSFRENMSTLMKGFKRTIVQQKVDNGELLEEGKEAMSFACYKLLCKKFFEGKKDEYLFALLFLTLEWNLIARSDNIVNLSLSDFEWTDDSLVVYLKKTKTDQEGENGKVPFHLYANPSCPEICPVLALGMYLVNNPGLLAANGKLFTGDFQYNRYADILNLTLKKYEVEFARIGVKVGTIGTHSARKGAATLAASGCTISPSMASICTRAGWTLGGTRDKYIKYESAGDQFLGRTVCGLNSLVKEFSISPPFFNMNGGELGQVDHLIRTHIVGAGSISITMFEVLRMTFASIVYHQSTLMAKLHPQHRFRSHPFFSHLPQSLSPSRCRPMLYDEANDCERCPRLTGIPPHVAILNEMASLKSMFATSSADLKSTLHHELNQRGIGGEAFQANSILEDVKKVHQKMESILTTNFSLNSSNISSAASSSASLLPGLAPPVILTQPDVPVLVDTSSDDDSEPGGFSDGGCGRRKMYCWGGRLHNVPENFVLPRMTLQTLIIYWFCGSIQPHCPPLKYVNHRDFPGKEKYMRVQLNQMKRMIKEVVQAGQKVGFFHGNRLNMNNTGRATQLYEAVHKLFEFKTNSMNQPMNHNRRHSSLMWKTYHNTMQKNKWKLVGEP